MNNGGIYTVYHLPKRKQEKKSALKLRTEALLLQLTVT